MDQSILAMKTVIVIPARYGSSRFPGKPLVEIRGKSMIQRVWEIAMAVEGVDRVLVASEDDRILDHVRGFGGIGVLTGDECRNGSERAFAAVSEEQIEAEVVINLQGDAILTPPSVIQSLISEMQKNPEVQISTPAYLVTDDDYLELQKAKEGGCSSGTIVVFDKNHDALYFSRHLIPFYRDSIKNSAYRHIGLYAFRFPSLEKYLTLEPTRLEQAESLEQLRALENGMDIRVVEVACPGRTLWSVDYPEDVARVEELIRKEGEIL